MTGVVKSWVYWPIIAGTVFLYKYKKQKTRFEARHPGQVAMAWPLSRQVFRTIKQEYLISGYSVS